MALLSVPDEPDRNTDLKKGLIRLVTVIAVSVVSVLGLVWYIWEHSPKPP